MQPKIEGTQSCHTGIGRGYKEVLPFSFKDYVGTTFRHSRIALPRDT